MSEFAIRVENLGKTYRISGKKERYRTLRDSMTSAVAAPFRRTTQLLRGQAYGASELNETLWALKDVSFEIDQGAVVGVIGRNGAGKSTLLKILSQITEPSVGYAEIRGRVGALLEVGTGFHPELTGRENIYLSGSILGMSRKEIDSKFDEIVDFAGIEQFIDTPIKHYSSGMGLRLGFSVAAHLIAEILLVDEVLAVGDAAFQKKCLDKMSDISGMGKTVLLVTHQLHTIRRLCPQTIWLDKGSVKAFGKTNETINSYENAILSQGEEADIAQADRSGFLRWGILADDQQLTHSLDQGQEITIQFDIALARRIENGKFRVVLQNQDGLVLWGNTISDLNLEKEHYLFRYQLPDLYLEPGSYYWLVYLFDQHGWLDKWAATPAMSVNTIALNYGSSEQFLGILNPPYEFSVKEVLVLQSD